MNKLDDPVEWMRLKISHLQGWINEHQDDGNLSASEMFNMLDDLVDEMSEFLNIKLKGVLEDAYNKGYIAGREDGYEDGWEDAFGGAIRIEVGG